MGSKLGFNSSNLGFISESVFPFIDTYIISKDED